MSRRLRRVRAIADLELTIAGIGFEVAVAGEIKDAKFQQAMDDLNAGSIRDAVRKLQGLRQYLKEK